MIRRARHSDVGAIVDLALEYIKQENPFPFMRADKPRIKEAVNTAVSGAEHFAWVAVKDGRVTGALIAGSCDNAFYQRKNLMVMLFHCQGSGGGLLVRRMMKWYSERPALRACSIVMESPNHRLEKHLVKYGFKPLTMYVGGRYGLESTEEG